jgi:hypothetical protein
MPVGLPNRCRHAPRTLPASSSTDLQLEHRRAQAGGLLGASTACAIIASTMTKQPSRAVLVHWSPTSVMSLQKM